VENTQWNINNLVSEKVLPPWLINKFRYLSPYTTSTLQNMLNKYGSLGHKTKEEVSTMSNVAHFFQ
jgi:hypothetical protein